MSLSIDWASFKKPRDKIPGGFPHGMVLFTGEQGGGKSLSQSRYVRQLQLDYGAKVYSATDYKYADVIIEESEIAKRILTKREETPTVFMLDEIQVLLGRGNLNAEEKGEILKAIAQQRKRNTSIVGTLQVFLDLDIIYRRQLKHVVNCRHYFGKRVQVETWLVGESLSFNDETNKYEGTVAETKIWKRNNEVFELYDTFEIVGDSKVSEPIKNAGKGKPQLWTHQM